jgi:hypothetical protein
MLATGKLIVPGFASFPAEVETKTAMPVSPSIPSPLMSS